MQHDYNSYIEAGFRIFPLHGVTRGVCDCRDKECTSLYKHPRASNWQYTPVWSAEQMDTMETYGHLATGWGVLVGNHLVIDIDPRNGGDVSYEQLCADTGIDFKKESGFVVSTGGGGWHIYFKRPESLALLYHLDNYPGVDFKSSGFVVGCGSLHASGDLYECEKGGPDTVGDTPAALLKLLEKKDTYRATINGAAIDVSDDTLADMLRHISPDCDYEQWIRVGMALHHSTGGAALDLWDKWSSGSRDKYHGYQDVEKRWHGFGKSTSLVTLGTLYHYAEEGGYVAPVTFNEPVAVAIPDQSRLDLSLIDLQSPPGFVGELTKWINNQCRYPREHLAVAAALTAVGSMCGLKYTDEYDIRTNLIMFCVSGSATGKEAIEDAVTDIMIAATMGRTVYGSIKSEQEMIRNFIDDSTSVYVIDELGLWLSKLANAKGTPYLEGILSLILSAFTKTNKYIKLGGDLKKATRKDLTIELSALNKMKQENERVNEDRLEELKIILESIDTGIKEPFLSILGFTTPSTFNGIVNEEQSSNGFIGRAIIVQEKETNPKIKRNFKRVPLPMPLEMTIKELSQNNRRGCKKTEIKTTDEAKDLLTQIEKEQHDEAERHKVYGLEPIVRRSYQMILKVSLILAITEGVRSKEHVMWAYKYIKRDQTEKINLSLANINDKEQTTSIALMRKILSILDTEVPIKTGTIRNSLRKYKKSDIDKCLAELLKKELISREEVKPPRGKTYYNWTITGGSIDTE